MSQLTICLIIFAVTIIGYCSGKLSLATFAISSLTALSLTGCLDAKTALGYFANGNVIMIAGMCIVAAGFNRTAFCMTVANKISNMSKGNMTKMVMGYVLIGMILSQFVQSPVAVFGIVAPMLAASAESMGVKSSKVMFSLGVTTIVTCCTLPVGAGATIAAELNGYLESYGYLNYTVGLLDPMKARLPMLIICVLYCGFIAPRFAPDEPVIGGELKEMKKAAAKAPLNTFQEYAGIFIFFGDVCPSDGTGKLAGYAYWCPFDGLVRCFKAQRGNSSNSRKHASVNCWSFGNCRSSFFHRSGRFDWRNDCKSGSDDGRKFLYYWFDFLYCTVHADSGNVEPGMYDDFPSDCNSNLCIYGS